MKCIICNKNEVKYSNTCKSCANKKRYENPEYRKHFSELLKKAWKDRDWGERNKKISKALTGKKLSEEHKKKIGAIHKGMIPSKEARLKMSWAHFNRQDGKIRKKNIKGYITIFMPEHPEAMKGNGHRVYEHRLVMEKKIGRYLKKDEFVHHLNRIKDDNRPENLYITSRNDHKELEVMGISCPKCNNQFNVFIG